MDKAKKIIVDHENIITDKIIDLLKSKPDEFTSRWSVKNSMGSSIRHKNGNILIMIETGQIIQPIEPNMSKDQINAIKKLIIPILEADSKYILDTFMNF